MACSAGLLPEARAIYAEGTPHADDLYRGLRFACMNNHLPMAKWLSTVYDFFDFCMDGLFLIACFNDNLGMAQWLAEEGCDVHCLDQDGSSAMFRACCKGSLCMVEWLYGKGFTDLRVTTDNGASLLLAACTSDNLLLCQWLYDRCPDIVHIGDPLLAACKRGNVNTVRWLYPHSNINYANMQGRTGLWFACYYGHIKVAKFLLQVGAEFITDDTGLSPVWAACSSGSLELMQLFFESHPPGRTELFMAADRGNIPMLEWLVQEIGHQQVPLCFKTMNLLLVRLNRTLRTHDNFQVFITSRLFMGNNLVKEAISEFVGVVRGRKLRNVRECVAFW